MTSLTRRMALKMGFGSALAAPAALSHVEAMRSGALLGGATLDPRSGGVVSMARPTLPGPLAPAQNALRRMFNREREDEQLRAQYRVGLLDHDVAAMGSWSLAFKASVQMRRQQAKQSLWSSWRRQIWGIDDD